MRSGRLGSTVLYHHSSKLHWVLSLSQSPINLLLPRLVAITVCLLLMQFKVIIILCLLPKPSNKTKTRSPERTTVAKGRYLVREKVGCYSPSFSSIFIYVLISHTVFTQEVLCRSVVSLYRRLQFTFLQYGSLKKQHTPPPKKKSHQRNLVLMKDATVPVSIFFSLVCVHEYVHILKISWLQKFCLFHSKQDWRNSCLLNCWRITTFGDP